MGDAIVSGSELRQRLEREAHSCYSWSNGPGYSYGAHSHSYRKVLYCVAGSITFHLRDGDLVLRPGERMELPAGTIHSATVGQLGVTCIEGQALDPG